MDWTARVLVIVDGSLASLVACVAAKEASLASRGDGVPTPPRPAAWVPGTLPTPRREAASRIAVTYGLELITDPSPPAVPETSGGRSAPLADLEESEMLVRAAYAGAHHGCPTVFWPAQAPVSPVTSEVDVNAVSRLIDKALLVGRLCALDAEHHQLPSIRVDAPYADFTDQQLADLARDLDVRLSLCWWWEDPQGESEKARWTRAYEGIRSPIA